MARKSVHPPMVPAVAEKKGPEHRKDERHSFAKEIPIVTELGGQEVFARGVDLSAGGCFLVASVAFEVGEVIMLTIPLPDKEPIRVFGQVCHRRVAKGGFGYGIAFVDLAKEELDALHHTCSTLPPPVPKKPRSSKAPATAAGGRKSKPPAAQTTGAPGGSGRRTS